MYRSAVRTPAPPFRFAVLACLLWLAVAPLEATGNGAQFIEFQVPNEARAGLDFPVTVTMKNTGTSTWDLGSHAIGLRHDPATDGPTPNLVDATSGPTVFDQSTFPVAPQAQGAFELEVEAPLAPGAYEVQFQMLEDGGDGFGDFSSRVIVRVVCPALDPTGDNAEVVSVARPEDVQPGGDFEVQVTMRNTGQNCWTPQDPPYLLGMDHAGEQNPWDGPPYRFLLPAGVDYVLPGAEVTFRVPLTAKSDTDPPVDLAEGSYPATFRMNRMAGTDAATGQPIAGAWFGQITASAPLIQVIGQETRKAEVVQVDAPPRIVPDVPSYPLRVTVRNTGSAVWTPASKIMLGMTGSDIDWSPRRYLLPPGSEVKPGQEVTFTFELLSYGVSESDPDDSLEFRMIKDCMGFPSPACGWFGARSPAHTVVHWDMSEAVTASADAFWVGDPVAGNEFVASGFSLVPYYQPIDGAFPPGVRSVPNFAWYTYDEAVIEAELREMARLGATTVRVWLPGDFLELDADDPGDPLDDPTIDELYQDRILHLLASVRANGLRAILALGGPIRYRQLLVDACAAGEIECIPNFAVQSRAIHDPATRRFLMQRYAKLIEAGDLADRPEVLSLNLWVEMKTGDASVRDTVARDAWNAYLADKYLQHQENPCTVWSYSGQAGTELAAACADNALSFPPPDDVELCCDPAGAGCDLTGYADDWTALALDYRSFVDLATVAAHQEVVDGAPGLPGLRQLAGDTLLTAGIGGVHREEDKIRQACRISGHWPDPRVAQSTMDYVAVDSYPWNDLDEALAGSAHADRYDRLKLILDYARGSGPILLEETGYNTCNTRVAETTVPRATNASGDCAARDLVQAEVYREAAGAAAEVQTNGALYFSFRDRRDRAQFGSTRLDGSRKPVYQELDDDLAVVGGARDAVQTPACCVTVDPCADVSLPIAILEALPSYQQLGPGPVSVVVSRPVGDDCQTP